jgi:hypothetical protein
MNKILDAIEYVEASMELMRGFRGSVQLICLCFYLIQVQYA